MSEEEAEYYMRQVKYYRENLDYGIVSNAAVAALGDGCIFARGKLIGAERHTLHGRMADRA